MFEDKTKNNYVLDAEQKYKFGDILFIVEPTFKKEGKETLTTVLLKLMQSEFETT